MTDAAQTYFAPPERAPEDIVFRQYSFISKEVLLTQVLDALIEIALVLNTHRQIVYANRTFLDFIRSPGLDHILGLRPGEAIQCVRCSEAETGCGTTKFCKMCGAVNAILSAQTGSSRAQECHILVNSPTGVQALDLFVIATPVELGGERFIVFTGINITEQERSRILERIFFHDLLNTAGNLRGFAELLMRGNAADEHRYKKNIKKLCSQLIDEIQSQRELIEAEHNELTVEPEPVDTAVLLRSVIDSYRDNDVAEGRSLILAEDSASLMMTTDMHLLRRVLENMIKNALEATPPGGEITVHCSRNGGRVRFAVHQPGIIPPDVQLQIFQHSFTTKGKGRGLGTYTIKLLSERYLSGAVWFVSAGQEGTTFYAESPLMFTAEV